MAVSPVSISPGTYVSATATTIADTTNTVVASGSKIIGVVTWFGSETITSVSGSLTWTVHVTVTGTADRIAIISADAPAGLASGTTITVTFTGSQFARGVRFASCDGLGTNASGALDGTDFQTNLTGPTSTTWQGSITTTNATDVLFGSARYSFAGGGMTPAGGSTEIYDWTGDVGGDDAESHLVYKEVTSAGANTVGGSCSAENGRVSAAVAFKTSGGAAAVDAWTPLLPGFMVGEAFPAFMRAFSAPFSSDAATGLTQVSTTRSTTWNVKAQTSAARSTTWDVLSAVSATRATTWDVLGAVAATRATTWRVLASVAGTRATTWRVLAQVAGSKATTWDVLTSLTATRATTWDVLAQVSATRATTWNVASSLIQVSTTRATTWRVRAQTSGTRVVTWDVLSQTSATKATTWDVLSQRSTTRATTWNTKAQTATNKATSWDVLARTNAARSTTWNVKTAAAAAKATSWRVLEQKAASRATTWNVLSIAVPPDPNPITLTVHETGFRTTVAVQTRTTASPPASRTTVREQY